MRSTVWWEIGILGEVALQHVGRQEYKHDTGARPEPRVVEDRAPSLFRTLGAAMDRVAEKSECKYACRRHSSHVKK